jgi:hypothetical protein
MVTDELILRDLASDLILALHYIVHVSCVQRSWMTVCPTCEWAMESVEPVMVQEYVKYGAD